MLHRIQPVILALLFVVPSTPILSDAGPTISNTPLGAEELQVYGAFLEHYIGRGSTATNLGDRTVPIDLSPSPEDFGSGCLKGLRLENLDAARSIVHSVGATDAVAWPKQIRLVPANEQQTHIDENDPSHTIFAEGKPVDKAVRAAFASGLLTLSEIVFDQRHEIAVLSYGFTCGRLCGHGATVILNKTRGKWRLTKRWCSVWMS
jgi:hypothetical protein